MPPNPDRQGKPRSTQEPLRQEALPASNDVRPFPATEPCPRQLFAPDRGSEGISRMACAAAEFSEPEGGPRGSRGGGAWRHAGGQEGRSVLPDEGGADRRSRGGGAWRHAGGQEGR